jgi:hypothetical protein
MPITPKIDYSKSVPDFWTEEDKVEYDILKMEARKLYPDIDDFIIHIGILCHINEKKGLKQSSSNEEIQKEMEKYRCMDKVFYTPEDPNFNFNDTMVNVVKGSAENNLSNILEEENEILQTA